MMYFVFVALSLLSIFFPRFIGVLLCINALFAILVASAHLRIISFSKFFPPKKEAEGAPHVTIIVPAHNEPPALLMETLESISKIDYPAYGVIVIDNNTQDSSMWRPVRNFVSVLGERFIFFHVDKLAGYKAGALNYALKHMHQRSEYVAVVDADYVLKPDFIRTALQFFVDENVALVQFPQEYRNSTDHNQPLTDEYQHFFRIFMNMANHLNCVPSTGTVSVYRTKALRTIGGFRSNTLTEDADAGLRLYGAGYRGVYADTVVGYGLIPYDVASYQKQKHRWAVGNAQSLKTLFALTGKLPVRTWVGFFSHLTAWDHANFIPFATLAGYVLTIITPVRTSFGHEMVLYVATASIIVTFLSRYIVFLAAFRGESSFFRRATQSYFIHIGMTLLYSGALIEALIGRQRFARTNKNAEEHSGTFFKATHKELLLGVWFFVGSLAALVVERSAISFVAFFVSDLALFSILYVGWNLFPTRWHATRMLAEAEEKYKEFLKD